MRKFFALIVLVTVTSTAFAQLRHPVYSDWTSGYTVGAYGRYQIGANAVVSNLVYNIYGGRALPRKQRERTSNYLTKRNRLGLDADFGIYAKHMPESAKGIGWFINVAQRTYAHSTFSEDLLNLAMFGNAMFAGETADLSNLKIRLLTYKQYEIGILKQIEGANSSWDLGLGVALLTGNRSLGLTIDDASLYTDPDGEYLEGNFSGELRSSALSSSQYFDANGLGFSTSLHVGYRAKKFGITLQADDLGFISWNQRLRRTELDSIFTFDGLDINLFASGGGFSSVTLDSIVDGFATQKPGENFTTVLSGRVRLEGFYQLNEKDLKIYAGVQYRFAPAYVPYVYVGTSSPLPKNFFIDGRFAYGGFGSWHLGLELRKRFADFLEIRVGTNNLEGYVLPMVGTSQSAYISVAGFF